MIAPEADHQALTDQIIGVQLNLIETSNLLNLVISGKFDLLMAG